MLRVKNRTQRQSIDHEVEPVLGGHGFEPINTRHLNGGGGGGTQSTEPWREQRPYLEDTFREAQSLYNNYQPEWYPGQTTAGLTPEGQMAQQYAMDYATQSLPSLTDQFESNLGQLASGNTQAGNFSGYLGDYAQNMMQNPISSSIGQNLPYMNYQGVQPGQADWMSVSGPGPAPIIGGYQSINPMSASYQQVAPGMSVNPLYTSGMLSGLQVNPSMINGVPQAQAQNVGSMNVQGTQITGMPSVNAQQVSAPGFSFYSPEVGNVNPGQIDLGQFGVSGNPITADPNAAINQMLSGQVDTTGMNAALQAAFDPMIEQFQRSILPSIQDQEIFSGQMGGSTGDVARGLAAEGLADAMGNISSQFAYDAYRAAQDRQGQGANLASQAQLQQLGIGGQLAAQQAAMNQQAGFGNVANQLQAYGMGGDIGLSLAGMDLQSALANQSAGLQAGGMNQDALLRAALANQGVDLQAALANQGTGLQASLANQQAGLQSQGMNIDSFLQSALANQQAGLQGQGMNLDAALQAAFADQGAGLQAQGMNLDALMQSQLANQSAGLQSQGMTMDNYLQSMLANQGAGLNVSQMNQQALLEAMGLGQQAQLANQQAYGNTQGLNLDALMQAQLANQQAGLTAGGMNLDAMLQGQIAQDAANQGWAQLPSTYANMALQGMNTQSQDAFRAMSLYPQLAQMGTMPATLMNQVGDQNRALAQADIDNLINQWNFQQNYPIDALNQYANIVAGNNWGANVSGGGGGGAAGALGGAASGAAIGTQIMPGWGTAIGAIGGGLLGGFG